MAGAWARLLPWRETIAELFDTPDLSGALTAIEEVTIEHETWSEDGPSPPAVLLAGWLAGRLRWRPLHGEGHALRLASAHGPVLLTFRGATGPGTRTVSRVRFRCGEPAPLALDVEPLGHEHRARVTLERHGRDTERWVVSFPYRDFPTCVVSEIHRHAANPVLEEAVASVRALHEAWNRAA